MGADRSGKIYNLMYNNSAQFLFVGVEPVFSIWLPKHAK